MKDDTQPATGGRGAGRGGGGGRGGGRGGGGDGGGGGTPSPDGKWTIVLRDKQESRPTPPTLTDFEKRHEDRFKGVTFDWMEFQRDGQPFPAPNPNLRAAQQVVLQSADGGDAAPRVLVDQNLRPANIAWRPDGKMIAFVADPDWRDEIKYESPDLWVVSTDDGKVTRLTDDGYVYSDVEFSPDGKFLSYVRTFGTDMIIQQKLNHGGSRDLFVRSADLKLETNLTAKWDLEPGDSRWSPDGKYLYFTAATGGESHLFRVAPPGGPRHQRLERHGRADHERRAPDRRAHLQPRFHPNRVHRGRPRLARATSTSPTSTALVRSV